MAGKNGRGNGRKPPEPTTKCECQGVKDCPMCGGSGQRPWRAGDDLTQEAVMRRVKRHPNRQSLRTPRRAFAIVTALRTGATRKAACGHVGITPNTLWRWVNEDPEMARVVEEAEGAGELALVGVVRAAAPTDWKAAAWLLERRRAKDYGRRDRMDITVEARELARTLAEQEGLPPGAEAEIMADAERILAEHARRHQQEPE